VDAALQSLYGADHNAQLRYLIAALTL